MMRAARAFTLIELLVVIAIIAILSSVVLANLGTARQKGRDGKRVSDMKQIQLALELYYDNNSQYPVSGWSNLTTALNGSYISTTPNDPTSGNSYGYYATPSGCNNSATKCTGYYIGSIMESVGQVGALSSDNDTSLGGNNITVNGTALNCNENAGAANERLYCSSSL
jgi:prepilin-type N-terminal cleavage/methylation domain-containing protein